jgi:hypothetical protein
MFFSIDCKPQDNFSNFYQLGNLHLSTDAGWHETQIGSCHLVYKGYADIDAMPRLLDQIITQTEPVLLGNFCVIVYDASSNSIKIQTDRYRSFPIFFKTQHSVGNLLELEHTAWTDSLLEISTDLTVTEHKFDVIGKIDSGMLTEDEVVDQINLILETKTQKFLSHNQLSIHAHLTGGVDSLLVYSYLQKFDQTHRVIDYAHIDYDEFWLKNSGTLQKFWGYRQIHHWRNPCVLISGAPGDEFMLRSPTTCDRYVKTHGLNMLELLELPQWKNSLHYTYFKKSVHQEIFKNQTVKPYQSHNNLIWDLCNTVVNDWQHWHLGNTLTWTPLRDLEIFKLLLRLPLDSALKQIINSGISTRLIEQNYPGLTGVMSDQKNSGNAMANLCNFLRQHS